MALLSQYESFLRTFNPDALAKDAVLHYVPTLTSVREPGIFDHLSSQQKTLKKKQEKILSSIESHNGLFLEVETVIQFVNGGGAYLPGFDDNLVADRVVTLPILHIAQFDSNGKIQQIRQHWDQASLLKAIEVIGASGKNWPIKDGKAQAKLIATSAGETNSVSIEATAKQMGDVTITSKPTKKTHHPKNDPYGHNSLSSMNSRGYEGEDAGAVNETPVAPKRSSKPVQRDWEDLFVSQDSDPRPTNNRANTANRASSPVKDNQNWTPIAPKAGSGKNFAPSRLFDVEEKPSPVPGSPSKVSPEKGYIKTHPKKYSHFELSDGTEEPARSPSKPRPKSKHQSQWDFEDFNTPAKFNNQRGPGQGKTNFRIGDEDNAEAHGSPVKRSNVPQPRPDASANFELQDDGEPPEERKHGHPRGPGKVTNSASMYRSHMIRDSGEEGGEEEAEEDWTTGRNRASTATSLKDRGKDFAAHFAMTDDPSEGDKKNPRPTEGDPLAPVTNLKDRRKDFGPHFSMTDDSPGGPPNSADASNRPGLGQNRTQSSRMNEPSWTAVDDSPVPIAKQAKIADVKPHASDAAEVLTGNKSENPGVGIKAAGDGMGSRKAALDGDMKDNKENQGIKSVGDGMGGRKGAGRSWAFGEEDADEQKGLSGTIAGEGGRAPVRGRGKAGGRGEEEGVGGGARPGGGGFWDF